MFLWSDDCFSCLCGFPHSLEEHMEAVLTAQAELEEENEARRREYRLNEVWEEDDDMEWEEELFVWS